jgi:hypothetical protein
MQPYLVLAMCDVFGRRQKIKRKKFVTLVVVFDAVMRCELGRIYREVNGASSGPLTFTGPFQGPGRGYSISLEMT